MTGWLFTAGRFGGIITIIALVIALLRQVIELVGFLMFAIKIGLVLAFVGLVIGIGLLAIRTFQQRKRDRQS